MLPRRLQEEGGAAGGLRPVSRQLLHPAQTPAGPRLQPRGPPAQHGRVSGESAPRAPADGQSGSGPTRARVPAFAATVPPEPRRPRGRAPPPQGSSSSCGLSLCAQCPAVPFYKDTSCGSFGAARSTVSPPCPVTCPATLPPNTAPSWAPGCRTPPHPVTGSPVPPRVLAPRDGARRRSCHFSGTSSCGLCRHWAGGSLEPCRWLSW